MATVEPSDPYAETVVPRAAVSFPLRCPAPHGFDPDRPETWPKVEGRLEYIEGCLWYMPPSGDDQQDTTADAVTELNLWRRSHPGFVVGTSEAGIKLAGEVRAADVAIWREKDLPPENTGGWRRVPPVLALEVAGVEDSIETLRDKARWYLDRGVEIVWILVPRRREVIVIEDDKEETLGANATLPEHEALPGLRVRVADLFRQLDR